MADNTLTIGAGEVHTTIGSWELATDYDLVTATTRELGEVKSELFAEIVVIRSATTNANFYRWLRAKSGSEFDHTDGSGARVIKTAVADDTLVTLRENYVRLGGSEGASSGSIGFKLQTTSADAAVILAFSDQTNHVYSQCVVYQSSSSAGYMVGIRIQATPALLYNCLVYDVVSGGAGDAIGFWALAVSTLYNCVAYDLDGSGGDDAYGFHGANGTCYNCYAGGVVASDVASAFSQVTDDYCAADDATPAGAHSLDNKAAGNQFVSIVGGSEDFHLKSGADCIDAGNDGYNNDFDIDGSFAGARDDIGVHEYIVVGGATACIVGAGVSGAACIIGG